MKHFYKLAEGANVHPLLHSLQLQPELWNANTLRTTFPNSPHSEADDILVFFNSLESKDIMNDKATIPYPAWQKLPQARALVFDLMRMAEATQLGRVIITRLKPGASIKPHKDEGDPVTFYKRYQIALQSLPGSVFKIGEEEVTFQTGEVWLINNKEEHSVYNGSLEDRIVMIVDVHVE